MAKPKFKYRNTSYAEAKKQIAESDGGSRDSFLPSSIQMYKAVEGPNKMRILPPGWDDAEHYGYRIFVHFNIGPNKDSYLCPYHTVNPKTGKSKAPCPICEERNRAQDDDADYARSLKAVPRVLIYLLDKEGKKKQPELKAWPMPATLDKAILQQAVDEDSQEVLPLDHPEDGYDITVYREGTKVSTKYTCTVGRRSSEVEDFEEIWEKISGENSLPNQLIFYDYDYLETVFNGGTAEGPEQSKKPKAEKKTKKKKSYEYDELKDMDFDELANVVDELELPIDIDEMEDEAQLLTEICEELQIEKPKRQSRSSRKEPEPEPEEEEQEEEQEEEEEEAEPEPEPAPRRAVTQRRTTARKEPEPEPEEEEQEEEQEEEEEEAEPESKKPSSRDRLASIRNRRNTRD